MSSGRKSAMLLLVIAVSLATVGSAQGRGGARKAVGPATTLVYAMASDTPSLDPDLQLSGQALRIFQNVYEGLARYDAAQHKLLPALATSWKVSRDGLTYTFELRRGVKFQDGTAFDAQAAVTNFDRLMALKGAPSTFFSGVTAFKATGRYGLTIRLSAPNPAFQWYLPFLPMISPSAIAAHTVGNDDAKAWLSSNMDGTGPYELQSYQPSQETVLVAFKNYWGGWQGNHIKTVRMVDVPEPSTERLMLESGQAQMIDTVLNSDIKPLAASNGVKVVVSRNLSNDLLFMNEEVGPLSDVNVRKALEYAFPYAQVFNVAYDGLTAPAGGPLNRNFSGTGATEFKPLTQNMTLAKSFLAASKFPTGGFSLRFEYASQFPQEQTVGLLLQNALQQLNIQLDIVVTPFPQMIAAMANQTQATMPQLVMLNMSPVTNDPFLLLKQIYGSSNAGGAWNWSFYRNPVVDQLVAAGTAASSPKVREADLVRIQKVVINDAVVVPVQQETEVVAMAKNLEGYVQNPYNYSYDVYFYDLHFR